MREGGKGGLRTQDKRLPYLFPERRPKAPPLLDLRRNPAVVEAVTVKEGDGASPRSGRARRFRPCLASCPRWRGAPRPAVQTSRYLDCTALPGRPRYERGGWALKWRETRFPTKEARRPQALRPARRRKGAGANPAQRQQFPLPRSPANPMRPEPFTKPEDARNPRKFIP